MNKKKVVALLSAAIMTVSLLPAVVEEKRPAEGGKRTIKRLVL